MVVLDSSFVVAFHNSRDVHHLAAAEAMDRLVAGEWGRALLLEYVFLETVTVLLARRGLETRHPCRGRAARRRNVEGISIVPYE